MNSYAAVMAEFAARAGEDGVRCMAFGDLYLQDVRRYREERLPRHGDRGCVPAVGKADAEIAGGDARGRFARPPHLRRSAGLPPGFTGCELTPQRVESLPAVDPCGENGEFHTFVFYGPMFTRPLDVISTLQPKQIRANIWP